MPFFVFQPDQEVVVRNTPPLGEYEPMSFAYSSKDDTWYVKDPKTTNWITFMVDGVPEIYRAQVLLLVAAYPD